MSRRTDQRFALRSAISIACAITTLPSQERATTNDWDVEAFVRDNILIDGCTNYYSTKSGTEIGQPDFRRDKLGRSVKESTGIDVGGITIGTERSMRAQFQHFKTDRFKGAMLIESAADLDTALREKKYGVLFYSQTHYPLGGKVDNIEKWYASGLRIFQLQYGSRDGNQGPAEKLGSGSDQKGGLTKLGRKVVHELVRLNMIIDLSHCNEETILDTCKLAKKLGVAVTANHSGARGCKLPNGKFRARYARNITDRAMRAIASTGGLVGVMAYGPYLRGPYQKLRMSPPTRGIPPASIDDFVAHIDYMVKVIGPKHVGFSTDGYLDGTMAHNRTADGILDSPRRWKAALSKLHEMGYSDADLRQIMGLNYLRIYKRTLRQ